MLPHLLPYRQGEEETVPGKLNWLSQGQTLLKNRDGSLDSFLTADNGVLFPLSLLTIQTTKCSPPDSIDFSLIALLIILWRSIILLWTVFVILCHAEFSVLLKCIRLLKKVFRVQNLALVVQDINIQLLFFFFFLPLEAQCHSHEKSAFLNGLFKMQSTQSLNLLIGWKLAKPIQTNWERPNRGAWCDHMSWDPGTGSLHWWHWSNLLTDFLFHLKRSCFSQ